MLHEKKRHKIHRLEKKNGPTEPDTMSTLLLIKEAILALKDRSGSSAIAINKYLESEKKVRVVFIEKEPISVPRVMRVRACFFDAPNRIGPAYPNKISTSQSPMSMIHSFFDPSTLWLQHI
jgi:hypothetical protein